MSMKLRDIHEGKAYIVNDWNIRYVRHIDRRKIYYAGFALPSGKYVGLNECQTAGFTNWADREVTPEEFATIKLDEMNKELEKHDGLIQHFFSFISDADLIKEVRRRGLAR